MAFIEYIDTLVQDSRVMGYITLCSIFLAVIFYWKSKRNYRLNIKTNSIELVGRDSNYSDDNIRIFYKDREVNDLKRTWVTFWNSGNDVIYQSNVSTSDKIRLEFPEDGDVFRYGIYKSSNDGINARVRSELKNCLSIDFDFIDPKAGFVIDVIHNTNPKDLKIGGSIARQGSVTKLVSLSAEHNFKPHQIPKSISVWQGLIILSVLLISSVFCAYMSFDMGKSFLNWWGGEVQTTFMIVVGAIGAVLFGAMSLGLMILILILIWSLGTDSPRNLDIGG